MTASVPKVLVSSGAVDAIARRPRRLSLDHSAFAYALLAPLLVLVSLVTVFPLILTGWTSISSTSLNGVQNFGTVMYERALTDPETPSAVINGLIWAVVSMFLGPWLGLILAALVEDGPIRPKSLFRFLFFIPYFFSLAVAATIFGRLYDPSFGLVNALIRAVGFSDFYLGWLGNTQTALAATMVVFLWHEIPFSFIVLSSATRQIDRSLYEAAQIDGASGVQILRSITIPSLLPIIRTLMMVMFIAGLLAFAVVYALTFPALGGPGSSTEILPTLIFQQGLIGTNVGEAAALSILLVVAVVAIMFAGSMAMSRLWRDE